MRSVARMPRSGVALVVAPGARAACGALAVLVTLAAPALGGCGPLGSGDGGGGFDSGTIDPPNPPPQSEIDDAQSAAEAALAALERARVALELLGILPVYDCGPPRSTFVGQAVADLMASIACATAATAAGATSDTVTITFAAGCQVLGHTVEGDAVFTYSGGMSLFELEADFWGVTVEGEPLQVLAGYGKCGDEERYWVDAEGTLTSPAITFTVDATVAMQPGLPFIGGTTLIIDGTGSVIHATGTDSLTFVALEYEIGEILPASGTLVVQTASGHRVEVTFTQTSPVTSTVSITIDEYDTVTVPIFVSPL